MQKRKSRIVNQKSKIVPKKKGPYGLPVITKVPAVGKFVIPLEVTSRIINDAVKSGINDCRLEQTISRIDEISKRIEKVAPKIEWKEVDFDLLEEIVRESEDTLLLGAKDDGTIELIPEGSDQYEYDYILQIPAPPKDESDSRDYINR